MENKPKVLNKGYLVGKLRERGLSRRDFATRYCKTIQAFRFFTALACAWLRLKLYVDTP